MLIPVADLGWIYGVSAAVLGAMFIAGISRSAAPDAGGEHAAVRFSITYVTLLFGAMTLDVLVQYGW